MALRLCLGGQLATMYDSVYHLGQYFQAQQRQSLYFAGNLPADRSGIHLMSISVAAFTWLAWDTLIHLDLEACFRIGSLSSTYTHQTARLGTACVEVCALLY